MPGRREGRVSGQPPKVGNCHTLPGVGWPAASIEIASLCSACMQPTSCTCAWSLCQLFDLWHACPAVPVCWEKTVAASRRALAHTLQCTEVSRNEMASSTRQALLPRNPDVGRDSHFPAWSRRSSIKGSATKASLSFWSSNAMATV